MTNRLRGESRSRVGIFGHSFRGAVAAEVCRTDSRFTAGVIYDALILDEVLTNGIGKPFLFLNDGTPIHTPAELARSKGRALRELTFIAENARCIRGAHPISGSYRASTRRASHMNFCDSPMYTPVKRFTHAGSIRPERAMVIINAHTLSFFNAYLNEEDEHLLDAPVARYPEAVIESLYTGE